MMFMNPGCRSKFHAAGNQNNGLMGIVDPQHHARAPQSATRHVRQLHNNFRGYRAMGETSRHHHYIAFETLTIVHKC